MDADREKSEQTRKMAGLATLWSDVQPSVAAFVRASVRDRHDCEDVLQETVQYIAEHFDDYDSSRPFVAWAIGIARYRVLEYRNKRQRDQNLLGEASLRLLRDAMIQIQPMADARRQALEVCVSQLTNEHRDLLRKRYYEGLSVDLIARELQKKANTVTVKLVRIRKALARCVQTRVRIENEDG